MPMDISAKLAGLEAQKKDPLPTPHVGDNVTWFSGGVGEAQAAMVTRVLRPGIVDLTVFPPGGMPRPIAGAVWKRSDEAAKKSSPIVHSKGTWEYILGKQPLKSHYDLHLAEIERRIKGLVDEKRRFDDAEVLREQHLKEKAGKVAVGA